MIKQPYIGGRIRSFQCAGRGIRTMLTAQHNARLHALATALVVITGCVLQISRQDWCWIVLAVMAVWTAEALNTALELLCDVASPDFHPLVEQAKDVAAAAVLLSAMGAAAVGLLVFVPHVVPVLSTGY